MICNHCSMASICKVFEIVVASRPYVDVYVQKCFIKKEDKKNSDIPSEPSIEHKSPEKILEKSRRIKELQNNSGETENSDFRVVEPRELNNCMEDQNIEEPNMEICSICEEYIIWNSVICYSCNRVICHQCSVESADDKQTYCTDCF